jgi:hypothetical protein
MQRPCEREHSFNGWYRFQKTELAISGIQGFEARIVMNTIFVLLAVSAILGLVLGLRFFWPAILASGLVIAIISATILQKARFGFLEGVAITVVCLSVNQVAYLIGVRLRIRSPRDR